MVEHLQTMRIAVNGLFWGRSTTGSGQYTMKLLQALVNLDVNCSFLLALHAKQHLLSSKDTNGISPRLKQFTLNTPLDLLGENWTKLWFEQLTFPALCRWEQADIAHIPYWASPLWSSVPTVVTIHDLIPLMFSLYRGNLLVRLYSKLVSRSARHATYIVTDSEASRQDIIKMLDISPQKVEVVYLAADENFRPNIDIRELERVQKKYHLPEQYILYLGGFDARKNVAFLLQAYAQLVKEWREAPYLVIAGRLPSEFSEFFPSPQTWIDKLDLGSRVALIGWVDESDKPALYSGAELFIFPSDYEGFGLPVLESISCGTPAVVTDAGSLPEIVGEGGIRVPVGNLNGLTEAMSRILHNPDLRETLSQKGLAQANRFSWKQTAEQMLAIYSKAHQERKR